MIIALLMPRPCRTVAWVRATEDSSDLAPGAVAWESMPVLADPLLPERAKQAQVRSLLSHRNFYKNSFPRRLVCRIGYKTYCLPPETYRKFLRELGETLTNERRPCQRDW
jgi:hypothetical protein